MGVDTPNKCQPISLYISNAVLTKWLFWKLIALRKQEKITLDHNFFLNSPCSVKGMFKAWHVGLDGFIFIFFAKQIILSYHFSA